MAALQYYGNLLRPEMASRLYRRLGAGMNRIEVMDSGRWAGVRDVTPQLMGVERVYGKAAVLWYMVGYDRSR